MCKLFTSFLLCFLISRLTSFGENKGLPLKIKFNDENNTPLIFHITGDGGIYQISSFIACQIYDISASNTTRSNKEAVQKVRMI